LKEICQIKNININYDEILNDLQTNFDSLVVQITMDQSTSVKVSFLKNILKYCVFSGNKFLKKIGRKKTVN
jgi:hypothetical protein